MKNPFYFLLCIHFSFLLFSSVKPTSNELLQKTGILNESLNDFVDTVFYNIHTNASALHLEPLILPEITIAINSSFWMNPYEELKLKTGTLQNLENIYRYSDSTVSYFKGSIEVVVPIQFQSLKVDYDFSVSGHIPLFNLVGKIKGEISSLYVNIDLVGNINTLEFRAKEISFPHPGKLDVHIETSMISEWIINSILKIFTTFFTESIMMDVQNAVETAVNNILNNIFHKETPKHVFETIAKYQVIN